MHAASRSALALLAVLAAAGALVLTRTPPEPDRTPGPPTAGTLVTRTVEDTYVTALGGTASRGGEPRLRAGSPPREHQALVKFTVAGVPAGACPVEARLRLWSHTAADAATAAHTVDPARWREGTAWRDRPPLGEALSSAGSLPGGGWAVFDVSRAVTGDGTFSFAVTHAGPGPADFAAREDRGTGRPAELEVRYAAAGPDDRLAPACGGAWWGLYRSGNADVTPYETGRPGDRTEPRRFDAFRRYYSLSQITGTAPEQTLLWPTAQDAELARDRVLFLQIDGRCFGPCPSSFNGHALPGPAVFDDPGTPPDFTGEWIRPGDVAAGRFDPLLNAAADRLKAFPGRIVLDLSSEIDTQVEWMTDRGLRDSWTAGYRDMWRHVHALFTARGVTNVRWNYVVGGFSGDDSVYTSSYPGDAYVDWISWDPYDSRCSYGSARAVLNRFYARLEAGLLGPGARGKAYGIMEFGFGKACQEAYFRDLADDLKRLPKIRAVLYFDRPSAEYALTPAGRRGYADAAADPYLDRRP
ncbi:hypothetical protein ACFOWE_10675 [Planomonospora corallina]|uniref:GH26 domain-containing protein n=1 Tax=Planomonospora corallina TaxID=1806052 RepID=A0ABV8I3L6_9ACTN